MTQITGPLTHPPPPRPASQTDRVNILICSDPASLALLDKIELVAPSQAPVLIMGETGTGKELVARHLHARSNRTGEFVAVNCGALTESLAEAELFGHQAGSFSGANDSRAGWFESAEGGTLFLDEIADLPMPLQVKLLRVLQEREVVRVGARKAIPLNFRLIAATNVDLPAAVAAGRFRLDLYYRLNVVTLDLPPLRERRGDIPLLLNHFLRTNSAQLRTDVPTLSQAALDMLCNYSWPGNIRELDGVVHFAILVNRDGVIRPENLRLSTSIQSPMGRASPAAPLDAIKAQLERLFESPPAEMYQTLEAMIVKRAFGYCGGNQVHTARLLGVSRSVVRTLLKRFDLLSSEAGEDYEEIGDMNGGGQLRSSVN